MGKKAAISLNPHILYTCIKKAVLKDSVNFSILLIVVEGGDSCLEQRAGKMPQTLKASQAHRTPGGKRPPAMKIIHYV